MATYEITDLGTIGNGTPSALGLNSNNTVVGKVEHPVATTPTQAFVWDLVGGMRPLPSPAGAAEARAVNDVGTVVGAAAPGLKAVRWNDPTQPPQQLMTPPGFAATFTHAINNFGLIGGGANDFAVRGFGVPVFWSVPTGADTTMGPVPAETLAEIRAITNGNPVKVVGTIGDKAFAVSAGDFLTPLTTQVSTATSVNDAAVVGGSIKGVPASFDPQGNPMPLTLVPTFDGGEVRGINNSGRMVGQAWVGPSRLNPQAFLWGPAAPLGPTVQLSDQLIDLIEHMVPGFSSSNTAVIKPGMIKLDDLIDPSLGWHLTDATGINASGSIIGQGTRGGQQRAFIMRPLSGGSLGQAIVETVTLILVGGRLGDVGWGIDQFGHIVPIPGNNPEEMRNRVAARNLAAATLIYEVARLLLQGETQGKVIRKEALLIIGQALGQLSRE